MTTRLGRVLTYGDRKPPMESPDPLIMSFVRSREKFKTYYLLFCKARSMVLKLGRAVN